MSKCKYGKIEERDLLKEYDYTWCYWDETRILDDEDIEEELTREGYQPIKFNED